MSRRLKCVRVSRELIEQFLVIGRKQGPFEIVEGLPDGARLVGVAEEPNRWPNGDPSIELKSVRLVFEHDSFPEVSENLIPDFVNVVVQLTAEGLS